MRIKKLHLKDYKRFHDLTIDLGENPARIVALIGQNGCGKSSVLDSLIYKQSTHNAIGSNYTYDINYHSLSNANQFGKDNVDIIFDNGNFEQVFNQAYLKDNKGKTLFSFRSAFRYNGNLNVKNLKAISNLDDNSDGASSASSIDQRIEMNYQRFYVLFNEFQKANKKMTYEDVEKHFIDELNYYISKCLDLKLADIGDILSQKGMFLFKKNDSDITFEYKVLSAGEKEVVDILLDLYLRKNVYTNTIYIIDEPELHINTSIQNNLLHAINEIIPENCQIWIASHSIGMMRALQYDFRNLSQIIFFDENSRWALWQE